MRTYTISWTATIKGSEEIRAATQEEAERIFHDSSQYREVENPLRFETEEASDPEISEISWEE